MLTSTSATPMPTSPSSSGRWTPRMFFAAFLAVLSSRKTQAVLIDTVLTLTFYTYWTLFRLTTSQSLTKILNLCSTLPHPLPHAIIPLCRETAETLSATSSTPTPFHRALLLLFIFLKQVLAYHHLRDDPRPPPPALLLIDSYAEERTEIDQTSRPFELVITSIILHTAFGFLIFGLYPRMPFSAMSGVVVAGGAGAMIVVGGTVKWWRARATSRETSKVRGTSCVAKQAQTELVVVVCDRE